MAKYNYKEKIINFSTKITNLLNSPNFGHSQYNELFSILQQMLFYCEQFFIELELRFKSKKDKMLKILNDRDEVISNLELFTNQLVNNNLDLVKVQLFLTQWKNKLESDPIYSQI